MLNYFHKQNASWLLDFCIIGILVTIINFVWLGHYPVFTPDEGRYSEIAREMIAAGDYITPRLNGVVFLDKPILYYWLQALAMKLFGINDWAIRFFPALLGVLSSLATYAAGRFLFDRRTGVLAAAILASAPHYFVGAHYANLDLEIASFVSFTLLAFVCSLKADISHKKYFLIASYVSLALAFLTKGLIAIVFPMMIIGALILLTNQWRLLKQLYLATGIILFAVITLPWYVLAQQANPEFFHYFFVTQQVSRFLSQGEFNNQAPIWFYLPIILLGFFPWSLLLPSAIWQNIKNRYTLFLSLWVMIITVFFSIPHAKIVTYILPIFPAAALLVAKFISERFQVQIAKVFLLAVSVNVLLLLALVYNAASLNNRSAKSLTDYLKPLITKQNVIVNYHQFYQDVPLYLNRTILISADWQNKNIPNKDNWQRELWLGMNFIGTKKTLIEDKDFWTLWNSKNKVFVFLKESDLGDFKNPHILARSNDIVLLSNV